MNNKITIEVRRRIADFLTVGKYSYHGALRQADFLNRMFDLSRLKSTDYRAEYNTAYKDILQHVDNNSDWPEGWVFNDERFDLMHCPDEKFLTFLLETINPPAGQSDQSVLDISTAYNKILAESGFKLYEADELKGKPIFNWEEIGSAKGALTSKASTIKKLLNTEYVHRKVEQMNNAVANDPEAAFGAGKELLETVCKSILKQKSVTVDKDWTLPQLLKQTTLSLDLKPKTSEDPERAERSIKQILSGISTIVQGISELRNAYGTGHGKDADFKGLEPCHARLFVGCVAEISSFFLNINGIAELEGDEE